MLRASVLTPVALALPVRRGLPRIAQVLKRSGFDAMILGRSPELRVHTLFAQGCGEILEILLENCR
jgi:hypothetical protein